MLTQPLREEHAELLPHVESLRSAADAIGAGSETKLAAKVREAEEFLTGHLIPHAKAEEEVLYPIVGTFLGAPGATRTMTLDHQEIGRQTRLLGELRVKLAAGVLTRAQENELRMTLYGLYALVKLHFRKEEEVFLPLLDQQLTQDGATRMFEAMEAAARKAKGA
jgi:iron-sulfur cluster repair protein YtfE (RIC family)